MLDCAAIYTCGGIVIWSKEYAPNQSNSLLRSLSSLIISSSMDQDVAMHSVMQTASHTLLYTLSNSLELIFVIAYSRILTLTYADSLILRMKQGFEQLCGDRLQEMLKQTKPALWGKEVWVDVIASWESLWEGILRETEMSTSKTRNVQSPFRTPISLESGNASQFTEAQSNSPVAVNAEVMARNLTALRHRQRQNGKSKKGSGSDAETGGSESDVPRKKGKGKEKRSWGNLVTNDDIAAYDFSEDSSLIDTRITSNFMDPSLKLSAINGRYDVEEVGETLPPKNTSTSFSSKLSAIFSTMAASKTLTSEALQAPLTAMKTHLMDKNVAQEVASKLCDAVGKSLEGRRVTGWSGIDTTVRNAMESTLTALLTPTSSTDILLSITRKKQNSSTPYAITFVGVNGVGKSTNLAKVAFWLIQNRRRVLIAACDTFRSGAVEQLRVHVRNLQTLGKELETSENVIELYEKGYGKDAAGIAKDAISYASEHKFDVVLIDTAGRMQDNEPLMKALAKLVAVNNPDKIIFVGEALVGNEAVDQLTKFNRALRDFSRGSTNPRGVDGMILTKFDTVSDQVGAAVSMTYVTNQPIFFVGTGQTYSDLRRLTIQKIVYALLN